MKQKALPLSATMDNAMRHHLMNTTIIARRPIAFANPPAPMPTQRLGTINVGMVAALIGAAKAAGAGDQAVSASEDLGRRATDCEAMMPYWKTTDDLITGYDAVRNAGARYLPRFADEADKDYDYRLACTKYTNVFRDIIETLSSKPFEEEITLVEDEGKGTEGDNAEKKAAIKAPDEIKSFVEDVDGAGNNLTSFAANTFFNGIAYAIDWIFIDYPDVDTTVVRSRADMKAAGIKPFWSHVLGQNVLEASSAVVNGNEQLVRMRILEPATPKNRVRVFERVGDVVTWGLFEENIDAAQKKTYVMIGSGDVSIGVIPLVPFYTGRRDGRTFNFFPVMRDAADLQVKLYQMESGLEFAKIMTAYPMLAANGIKPQYEADGKTPKKIAVGPARVLYSQPDGNGNVGNWAYVEPSAESLKFLADDVKATKEDLRELGRLPLTAQSGNLTVITTAFAAGKSKSAVSAWALRLKNVLENALVITGMWLDIGKEKYDPQVNVYDEFDDFTDAESGLNALATAREKRDISGKTYTHELQRRDVLSADFDWETDQGELLKETPVDDGTGGDGAPAPGKPPGATPPKKPTATPAPKA